MHLYRPDPPYFAGDCMPFYHAGVFHLFYLLDENHHRGNGGLGGHQWAHVSTSDLVHWQHHPLALSITQPEEAYICTGSVFWHDGLFYAFYAQRKPDWSQHLCMATSQDGIIFRKSSTNPLLSPPIGYGRFDFRDPFVFQMGECFHMLLTARREPFPLFDRGGCLLHLESPDLLAWQVCEPLIIPASLPGQVPECSDHFFWNGWYYLIFSQGLHTVYRIARAPFGPWQKPAVEPLDSMLNSVIKTSPIWDNRRLAVGFIGSREGDRDGAPMLWAGNIVFRELVQHPDGTLSTRFVPEMRLPTDSPLAIHPTPLTGGANFTHTRLTLDAGQTQEVAVLDGVPHDFFMRCHASCTGPSVRFGLGLRGSGNFENFIELAFMPGLARASLAGESIDGVNNLSQPFSVEVVFSGDVVEVCVAGSRCLIDRLPDLSGERLFLFCENGTATFQEIEINPLAVH
jgi:beta-fructofuranosidase